MLFAHLSDLHLGKRLCEAPLLGDQQDILRQVLALLDGQPVDGVLLAGDLYDKPVPPAAFSGNETFAESQRSAFKEAPVDFLKNILDEETTSRLLAKRNTNYQKYYIRLRTQRDSNSVRYRIKFWR